MAKTVNCHCVTVTSPLYLYPVPRWLKYTKWLGRRFRRKSGYIFKQMVGHANPTVWAFIAGMRLQQAISDDTMTAIAVGDKPPRRNVREIKKRDRLLNATPLYDSKPLLEFLDLIADI